MTQRLRVLFAQSVKGRRGTENNVLRLLREVGLSGLRSAEKFIPDFVFGLQREKLALFLNRLFTCDGSIEKKRVSYSSTSIRLVRQVQHLLLRFGIVGVIRDRIRDGQLYGAEIYVCGKDDILRYLDQIGVIGEKAVAAEQLRQHLYSVRCVATQLDRQGAILFDRIRSIEEVSVEPVSASKRPPFTACSAMTARGLTRKKSTPVWSLSTRCRWWMSG